jgi:RNA polymerase sigma-70 factor (ECF subfamily)
MTLFRGRPRLLLDFRGGQRRALEEVYWAYVGKVAQVVRYGFFRGGARVSGARPHEVSDLVQEIFARAFAERARLAYDGVRDYGPYLLTIARNLLADRLRQSGRELPLEALPESLEGVAADGPIEWADPATVSLVEEYLASLAPELRQVHEARYVRGLTQTEAASELGLSRQQLRTREAHLRDGLERVLKAKGLF